MYKLILCFVVICIGNTLAESKRYRSDYIYNNIEDAYYKFNIMITSKRRAQKCCEGEGAKLMIPRTTTDVAQAHALIKQYPDLGPAMWVDDDGQTHESGEERPIIDLSTTNLKEDPIAYRSPCIALTRDGEIEIVKYTCHYHQLPFICKVAAKDIVYNSKCDTYIDGYIFNETTGSCYKIPDLAYEWGEAVAYCEAEGGHLAIVNSEAERVAIWELAKKYLYVDYTNAYLQYFYLLGFKAVMKGDERIFKTLRNETLLEAGCDCWGEGEPNNNGHNGRHEDCGSIFRNDGKFNDVTCSDLYPFVCEKEMRNPQ